MADYGIAPSASKSNEGFRFTPIAPPASSLWQDYQAAGNPNELKALLPRAAGTTLEPEIQRSVSVVSSGSQPIQTVIDSATAKGGLDTPEGRLALADGAKTAIADQQKKNRDSYKQYQPEVNILKGIAAGMMGVKNWQNLATQGVIRPEKEFDKDGKGAIVNYASNSGAPIDATDAETGQVMSMAEYEARGFGKYKAITETLPYKQQVIQTEENVKNFVKEAGASNVGATIFPVIAENSKTIYDGFSNLRKFGLTDNEINQLQKKSTMTETVSSAISSASQEFRQANDMTSIRTAIDKINKVGADAGIPKIVGINGTNSFTDSNGTTINKQDLIQRMTDLNTRSGRESQYTKNRELIVKDAVYQKLEGLGAKAEFDKILNLMQSNELLKADYRTKYGEPPVFAPSLPYQLGQPMKVGMANAIIDQANAKIAVAYQEFFDSQAKSGPAPSPGQISAAFIRKGIPQPIAAEYKKQLDAIQASPDVEIEAKVVAVPKVDEPAKPANTPKSRSILTSGQNARLAETPTAGKAIAEKVAKDKKDNIKSLIKAAGG